MIFHESIKAGYCYLILYKDKDIKVGRTRRPLDRMKSHKRASESSGCGIAQTYITNVLDNQVQAEASMHKIMLRHSTRVAAEVFRGIDVAVALSVLESDGISFRSLPDETGLSRMDMGVFGGSSGTKFLTGMQIRSARAALGWSTKKMTSESGIEAPTLSRFERIDGVYKKATIETAGVIMSTLMQGLDSIGWHFTESGGVEPIPAATDNEEG